MNASAMHDLTAEMLVAIGRSIELSIVAKATLTIAAGLSAAWLARRARASVRHYVLASTLVALLALPFALLAMPAVTFGVRVASDSPQGMAGARTQPARQDHVAARAADASSRQAAPARSAQSLRQGAGAGRAASGDAVLGGGSALAGPRDLARGERDAAGGAVGVDAAGAKSEASATSDRATSDRATGDGASVSAPAGIADWLAASWPMLLRVTWLTGTLLMLASLSIALWKLGRVRRAGLPWTERGATARALADAAGVHRPIALVLHEDLSAPMTCGLRHPVIMLPCDAPRWSDADLRRALVHEIEHVRRADWLIQLLVRATCAVYWFHPLVWTAWRQLRLDAERACDDAVLRDAADDTAYAEQLVTLARRMSSAAAGTCGTQPTLAMASRGDLSTRVSAILDTTRRRERIGALPATVAAIATAFAVLAIAPVRARAIVSPDIDGDATKSVTNAASVVNAVNVANEVNVAKAADVAPHRNITNAPSDANPRNEPNPRNEANAENPNNAAASGGTPAQSPTNARRPSAALDRALLDAADNGEVDAISSLIAAGADVNGQIGGDGSPLIAAARGGHLAAVQLLLDRGADPNLAVQGDGNPLIMAARGGHDDVVRLLLNRGASIDQVAEGDENALIQASASGRLATVKLLVSNGADVNARVWAERSPGSRLGGIGPSDGEWRTPLSMARRGGHDAVVAYLLSMGARE